MDPMRGQRLEPSQAGSWELPAAFEADLGCVLSFVFCTWRLRGGPRFQDPHVSDGQLKPCAHWMSEDLRPLAFTSSSVTCQWSTGLARTQSESRATGDTASGYSQKCQHLPCGQPQNRCHQTPAYKTSGMASESTAIQWPSSRSSKHL